MNKSEQKPSRKLFILLNGLAIGLFLFWQQESMSRSPTGKHERKHKYSHLSEQLAQAQQQRKQKLVLEIANEMCEVLEKEAGLPETPDTYKRIPADATELLSAAEFQLAFEPYLQELRKNPWWRRYPGNNLVTHLPRELASIITGCLAAKRAGVKHGAELLQSACECGDYLICIQDEAGNGLIPFPAVKGRSGKAFAAAEHAMSQMDHSGTLAKNVRNGWLIDDEGRGGLNFDNGVSGVALLELYEQTGQQRYKQAALKAARWTLNRPAVPNWNYNSFSITLLARAYKCTKEKIYLDKAIELFRLGILPGQLNAGAFAGRWQDAHNAQPCYHYIIVQGLAELLSVLEEEEPARVNLLGCLRKALKARNFEYKTKGIANLNSAMEALSICKLYLSPSLLNDCGVDDALTELGRYSVTAIRRGRAALSPAAWGLYLEQRNNENKWRK